MNSERTDFYIDQEPDALFPDVVYFDEIEKAALREIRKYLQPYLQPIAEEKIAVIKQFVETKAPQYRATIKYNEEALENIEPGLSDDKLDLELHKLKSRINIQLKEQTQERRCRLRAPSTCSCIPAHCHPPGWRPTMNEVAGGLKVPSCYAS